ncbi:MAG: carboxypeptidase [Bacteroidetes bacterium]|nr:carboxypeptidase [Bacteroidota bacterium]
MKNRLLTLLALLIIISAAQAQAPASQPPKNTQKISAGRIVHTDTTVVTKHTVTIKGQVVPYTATAGMMPVWDEDGRPIAGVFYTYYERDDVKDRANRPLVISFNGGPGTPSVWMELGYTGPRMLNADDEGYPVEPYGFKENSNSILDVADIVYVDPVNTGYSRPVNPEIPKSNFFGVNEDIKYLADWINTFVTRENRWASPKFLIGESYGTTRVSGLALALQDSEWMYLNGVILVSPTDLGINRGGPVSEALRLPYFAATAWYHKKLSADLQGKELSAMLPEVEDFTINEYIPALSKGGFLTDDQKQAIAAKVARYSGLSEKMVLDNNLVIDYSLFWKALLRDQGFTIGRLDSRYKGIDRQAAGEGPDYNPELTTWLQEFTPAINIYMRQELNYKTDLKYNMFGNVWPWDEKNDHTGENLRQAIAQNPFLHLLVQSGYYDGACDYFNAKYSLWQLDPSGRLKDRIKWEGYKSGHMLYLRKEDLATGTENLRKFILGAIPKPGQAAKY